MSWRRVLLLGIGIGMLAYGLAGCATAAPSVAIPNLHVVTPYAYRMGQPQTAEHWRELRKLGVTDVIDLACPREGTGDDDRGGEAVGIRVLRLCLSPRTDRGALGAIEIFRGPTDEQLLELDGLARWVATYQGPGKVAWHCVHGCDRTGMFRAMVGRYLGWSREEAFWHLQNDAGGCWHGLPGISQAWVRWNREIYGR